MKINSFLYFKGYTIENRNFNSMNEDVPKSFLFTFFKVFKKLDGRFLLLVSMLQVQLEKG